MNTEMLANEVPVAEQKADTTKSITYALVANSSIAILKFGGALYTHSGAMLAESIHSLADAGNQVLLLLGIKRSDRPASDEYPLGHGKVIYFWSFVVAIMLFSVGGLYSIYEGVHKLKHPEELQNAWVAVAILAVSIVIEGASMYGCILEVNKERGDRSFWQWFRETRQSGLMVIFGEDLAALLGLMAALCFVLLAILTGNPMYDALGSLVIGVLLVVIAIFITIQIKKLLVGRSAEPDTCQQIESFIGNYEGIEKVYKVITLQLGDHLMVAAKVHISGDYSGQKMIQIINDCESGLKEKFPEIMWLFFEPDNSDN